MKGLLNMYIFDQDIAVAKNDDEEGRARFGCTISPNWSVNNVPNGGYLMAVVANAMARVSEKRTTPLITMNYLSRTLPGEAEVVIERVSSSRQFDRIQAVLSQDGREKVWAVGTFAAEPASQEIRYEKKPPVVAGKSECFELPPFTSEYSIFNNIDARLDPVCAGWISGKLTEISEHKGWIRFKDGRPFDALSLLLMADAFPPPVFVSQGMVAWVPTIEFSVNVRSVPETEWIKQVFRTRFINNGLLEEDGELWDENGNLLAVSRQIAQYKRTG